MEQYVGQRIRDRRDELGMTQEEFGRQVGRWLGKPWSRSTVSVAENGRRAFTAAELVAIAHVLDTSPAYLFTPPAGIGEIRMPSGATFPRDKLFAEVTARQREDWNLAAIEETLRLLEHVLTRGQELRKDLGNLITQRVVDGGVVSLPLAPGMESGAERGQETRPPIVAAIVTSPEGVLVGRRNDGKPPWTFIAGEQDAVKDENPADTAVREVKEETGLRIEAAEVIGERDHPKTGRHMVYIAAKPALRAGTDVINGDPVELAEVRWVTLAEADELLSGMFEPVREYLARELGEAER